MRPDREAFLDACATGTTILRRPGCFYGDDGNIMDMPVVVEPCEETPPGSITDTSLSLAD
jgi:hypothetical protein